MLSKLMCKLGRHEPFYRGWGDRKTTIEIVECLHCDKLLKIHARSRR